MVRVCEDSEGPAWWQEQEASPSHHVQASTVCMQCPCRPEEGVRTPELEPLCWCWELNLGKEERVLLTAGPSPLTFFSSVLCSSLKFLGFAPLFRVVVSSRKQTPCLPVLTQCGAGTGRLAIHPVTWRLAGLLARGSQPPPC